MSLVPSIIFDEWYDGIVCDGGQEKKNNADIHLQPPPSPPPPYFSSLVQYRIQNTIKTQI